MNSKQKLLSENRLAQQIQKFRRQKKKIVGFSGSFDLLHAGHIRSLKEARAKGDLLVVFLNSDRSVRSYKGPQRPIQNQADRARMLASLECVNYVVIFDDMVPLRIIDHIRPDIYCQGRDWGRDCIEKKTVEGYGGKIALLRWTAGKSTTSLVQNILHAYSTPTVRAIFLDRDGTININQPEYLHSIKDFEFTPYALPALRMLSKMNYKIIIITSQSGIGRGLYTERQMQLLHSWMLRKLAAQHVRIDRIYHCPHGPDDGCACRKPKPGMLLQAVDDFGISLNDSWLIGDDSRDVQMGRLANIRTIRVGNQSSRDTLFQPHYIAANLLEAARVIAAKKK